MHRFDDGVFTHLEKLCRLKFSTEEKKNISEDLKKILNYVELLQEVDVENVPCCTHVSQGFEKTEFREDEEGKLLNRKTFLDNAPDQIGGMIRVPPVMKG